MKNLLLIFVLLIAFSCTEKGVTKTVFNGEGIDQEKLPKEIRNLKLYYVQTSEGLGSGVYVGVLENYNSTSLTYSEGKTTESIVIFSATKTPRTIYIQEILSETDSIIVIKKHK